MSARRTYVTCNIGFNVLDGTLDQRRLATSTATACAQDHARSGPSIFRFRFRLSLFYNGFSGRPYTYRITGDANADGLLVREPTFNDAIYVPRDAADITLEDPGQWEALDSLIGGSRVCGTQRGQLMRRNSCRRPVGHAHQRAVPRSFRTASGRSIELIADVFNVLNLIDGDWGVRRSSRIPDPSAGRLRRRRSGRGSTRSTLRGSATFAIDEATRWRMQLGARYTF